MSAEKASKHTEKLWKRSTFFYWSAVACLEMLCAPWVIDNCGQPYLQAWGEGEGTMMEQRK